MTLRTLWQSIKKEYQEKQGERFFSEKALLSALFEKRGLGRDALMTHPDTPLSPALEEALRRDARLLLEGEPLQYYLGTEFFLGREFLVRRNVLIPRPETECLVTLAKDLAPRDSLVLDLCCGSGCVGISLVLEREDLTCHAMDLSDAALSLTEENRCRFGVEKRLTVEKQDVLAPEMLSYLKEYRPSLILSNPPYLTSSEMKEIEENVKREPEMALFGGEDGLEFYRRFAELCKESKIPFLCEMGSRQKEGIENIASEKGLSVEFFSDMFGLPRVFLLS